MVQRGTYISNLCARLAVGQADVAMCLSGLAEYSTDKNCIASSFEQSVSGPFTLFIPEASDRGPSPSMPKLTSDQAD